MTELWGIDINTWGTWLGGLLTLAIYSFLYGDNPVYKACEHLFVGVSAAYGVVIVYHEYVIRDLYKPLFEPGELGLAGPKLILIIPIMLGLLLLSMFVPKYVYLSRWPIALAMGAGAGAGIPLLVQGNILKQLHGTMDPMWPTADPSLPVESHVSALAAFSAVLVVVGVVCTLSYFYFSLQHKGALGVTAKVGIWFLMVAFGAGFGNTVMARISLLIGRVQFLLYDFWPTVLNPFGPTP